MKLAIEMGPIQPDSLKQTVEWVQFAEKLGVDMAFAAEAWWSDAVTPLAYLAGKTHRIKLATGIMQTTARTPAMTAMSALTLHDLSGGRFVLGLGASGPQVVEGLHSTRYNKPLSRLRETVDICRMIFAGEKVQYQGDIFQMPLPESEGKPIKIAHEQADIPIYLATLGPNALRYTGATANGWLGTSFSPDHPGAHFDHLTKGATSAQRRIGDLDFVSHCYHRPRHLPDWPYNLFAMVHGHTQESVQDHIQAIAQLIGPANLGSDVLYSTRILKKTGLRLVN